MDALRTAISAVFVFGMVIFIHEFGHFITAKRNGVRVLEFALGMGPRLFGFTKGGTDYSLRLLPVGGFCMMEGEEEDVDSPESFSSASWWSRFKICAAGACFNMLLGLLILSILTATGGNIASRTIYSFDEGAVTKASGLREGDTIVKVNGKRLFTADDIAYQMMWIEDGTADLVVKRDGKLVTLNDVKFETTKNADGTNSIKIDFVVYGIRKNPWTVLKQSVGEVFSLTRQIYMSLVMLITGAVPLNNLSGPVGIVSVIGEASKYGISSLLYIMAYISIDLGIMNVLPIPALDGGKMLLILAEAVSGKKPSRKAELIINGTGFALLIGLMAFVTINDVMRLIK